MKQTILKQPSGRENCVREQRAIEDFFLNHPIAADLHLCFFVKPKNGTLLYGRPDKVSGAEKRCEFICEFANADRKVNLNFSEIDFLLIP